MTTTAIPRRAYPREARAPSPARIGPNAVLQVVAELRARHGDALAAAVLEAATGRTFETLPSTMVDEREVIRLLARVREVLSDHEARAVLWGAGERTAGYLLRHRIPRAAQRLLRLLPAPLAFPLLARAMAAHAWTFAGSGAFRWRSRGAREMALHDCPMCRGRQRATPSCDYYAATFDRLLRELVGRRLRVREVSCEAAGGASCTFRVHPR